MDNDVLIVVGLGLVMLLGLFGTLAPFLPGLPLIWGAALLYAFQTDWSTTSWVAMALITALLVGGVAAKIVLPSRRVAEGGAPRTTLVAGALGAIVGFFALPVVGMPLGAVAGVLLAEQRRTGDWNAAWASTKGAVVGFGIGALIEIGAGLAMIATWIVWVIAG